MKKRIKLAIATLLVVASVIGCTGITVVAKDIEEQNNKELVVMTMLADCYDKEQFKGTPRVEQMFVEETRENKDGYFITLIDTDEQLWEVENLDLYLFEEVLVLIVDNETPTDLSDDVIVHCWVGLE